LFNEFRVSQLMTQAPTRLNINDSMDTVARVFDRTRVWILPVVDNEGNFKGTIRKSTLLSVYRQMLADSSEE
jgi:CBS domain-containing protein